ncbi:MAG: HDOD domain-containing protein [Candidatus Caenarcaniphilales bacterium]|jgi:HD-like signal output (HDOD) protein|nr:HDOD domain-containing protein [Candidatus Caenarcaniphilales bacterium]
MVNLNTQKALFSIGLSAFGKLGTVLKNTDYLPQKPIYFLSLLKLAYSKQKSNQGFVDELLKDQALKLKLLTLSGSQNLTANASKNDFVTAVHNLENNLIENMIELELVNKYTNAIGSRLTESKQRNWKRCIKSAVIAKAVSQWVNYESPEIAFMSALLQDLPEAVLSINDTSSSILVDQKIANGVGKKEAQISVLGYDAAELGSKLFKYYTMPAEMVDLVQNDFDATRVKSKNMKLCQIVAFSSYIANCFSDKSQSPSSIWGQAQKSMQDLGLEVSLEQWGNKISLLFVKTLEFEMSVK